MLIERNTVYNINYEKSDGTISSRKIISLIDIPSNIKALDVDELNDSEIQELVIKLKEYREYVDSLAASTYDFSTWYEHTQNKMLDNKFQKIRTFTRSKMTKV